MMISARWTTRSLRRSGRCWVVRHPGEVLLLRTQGGRSGSMTTREGRGSNSFGMALRSTSGLPRNWAAAAFVLIVLGAISACAGGGEPANVTAWRQAIEKVDEALARGDVSRAEYLWHEADALALRS